MPEELSVDPRERDDRSPTDAAMSSLHDNAFALSVQRVPKKPEREDQFPELMAHLQQVFWIKNAAAVLYFYISPAYEKIWGRSEQSLYDAPDSFLDSIHPDDRGRMGLIFDREQETGGFDEEYRILRPDGEMRWIWSRSYPVRDKEGSVKRFAGIAEDITARKWAEKERMRLAAIIEYSQDIVVSVSLEGFIIGWNQGAEREYGYAAEEVLGRSISILFPPGHYAEYLEIMKKVKQGDAVPAYETVRLGKNGTLVNLSVGIFPIEARDGEIVGASKVGHDISRIKKLEAQFIEAQKMAALGQLAGGVAHDFNNILSVIIGYSDLIKVNLSPEDSLRAPIGGIRKAAERAVGLTRQLLIFSRNETVRFLVLDINEILDSIDDMLRHLVNEDIELAIVRRGPLGHVRADSGYVGQALMNLVINARDAMPKGGKLSIGASDVTLDESNATEHPGIPAGDYVMMSVGDTGTGMTNEVKARLFEPFFTTKPKGRGTGLGLATCQTIMNKLKGRIEVCSELGKGTTFTLYFPRVEEPLDPSTRLAQTYELRKGTETVIVVEDDRTVRQMACAVLKSQGYAVLSAANGEEALQVIEGHKGARISLVITDVVMPHMGGKVMADGLKFNYPDLKVLFTSGYADEAIARQGELNFGVAFLAKPYSPATLTRRVRELLDVEEGPIGDAARSGRLSQC